MTPPVSLALRRRRALGLLQHPIDFVQHVLHGELPKLTVSHELPENLFITFHAINDEPLEGFLKDVTEVVLRVRRRRFLKRVTLDGLFLNLVKEELVGLGETRTEALVKNVDEFRQFDLLVLLPGANVARSFERVAIARVEINLPSLIFCSR